MVDDYLKGALGRFVQPPVVKRPTPKDEDAYYRVPRPGLLWNGPDPVPLSKDGGRKRPASMGSPRSKKKADTDDVDRLSDHDTARVVAARAARD
jgi:site-specific DNA-methyltransferase (cytosine-N4-specific)